MVCRRVQVVAVLSVDWEQKSVDCLCVCREAEGCRKINGSRCSIAAGGKYGKETSKRKYDVLRRCSAATKYGIQTHSFAIKQEHV